MLFNGHISQGKKAREYEETRRNAKRIPIISISLRDKCQTSWIALMIFQTPQGSIFYELFSYSRKAIEEKNRQRKLYWITAVPSYFPAIGRTCKLWFLFLFLLKKGNVRLIDMGEDWARQNFDVSLAIFVKTKDCVPGNCPITRHAIFCEDKRLRAW